MMESWQMMKTDNDYWDLALRIVKKTAFIAAWLWILNNDPIELFMWLMAPMITLARMMSDLILDTTAKFVNSDLYLPDTCRAIHSFVNASAAEDTLVIRNAEAADLLCMPTRAAAFFYTVVAAGFRWVVYGLGHSGSTFLIGLILTGVFLYNIWKLALESLGAIVDLFLVLLFLPFTAVQECFGDRGDKKAMKYDGIFRPVWDEFVGFVKDAKLSAQIKKFTDATIYFIILAVMSAISIALLSGVDLNPRGEPEAMVVLIVGCLVWHMMGQAGVISKGITGVDAKNVVGEVGNDIWKISRRMGKTVFEWGRGIAKTAAQGKAAETKK